MVLDVAVATRSLSKQSNDYQKRSTPCILLPQLHRLTFLWTSGPHVSTSIDKDRFDLKEFFNQVERADVYLFDKMLAPKNLVKD